MGTATLKLAQLFPISRLILIGRSRDRLEAVRRLIPVRTEIVALEDIGSDWPTTKALVQRVRQLAPQGVDAIIDFMPSGQDIWQMMGVLATGGTIVHIGGNASVLPIPAVAIMANCWKIVGARSNTHEDAAMVLDLLADGRLNVDELITHRFPLGMRRWLLRSFEEGPKRCGWLLSIHSAWLFGDDVATAVRGLGHCFGAIVQYVSHRLFSVQYISLLVQWPLYKPLFNAIR